MLRLRVKPQAWILPLAALVFAIVAVHPLLHGGVIGYAYDWNIPNTPAGVWAWGTADLLPWRPIEFGKPMVYPTDLYLKAALALASLTGLAGAQLAGVFAGVCFFAGFLGAARLAQRACDAGLIGRIAAGVLYLGAPILFSSLVTGYITFLLAYAAFPWLVLALVRGHAARIALCAALTLAQVQYAPFDIAVAIAVLAGCRVAPGVWIRRGGALVSGFVLPYLFIVAEIVAGRGNVSHQIALSVHSWTSRSAPGLLPALTLQPSAYPVFFDALSDHAFVWIALGAIWVAWSLYAGLRSDLPLARALGVLLVVSLLALHGSNWPVRAPVLWLFEHVPALALFRNINYVFALVALLAAVLPFAPQRRPLPRLLVASVALVFGLFYAQPLWRCDWQAFMGPYPDAGNVPSIIGAESRAVVLPHLSARYPGSPHSGIDVEAVETISPIFVRDTSTGPLAAAIVNRVSDALPVAAGIEGLLDAGRIDSLQVQTKLSSDFAHFVNSYEDDWLDANLQTAAVIARLQAMPVSQRMSAKGDLAIFAERPEPISMTADTAVAVDGGLQHEAAVRSAGFEGIFVPATETRSINPGPAFGTFVRAGDVPPLLPSRGDLDAGTVVDAGNVANAQSADFHVNWADLLKSSNWWLSARMLAEPHAAVTSSLQPFELRVPAGVRHVWVEYFRSYQGSTLAMQLGARVQAFATAEASVGEYTWADLGTIGANDEHYLEISPHGGINAIARIMMLDPVAEAAARARYAAFSQLPTAIVFPDAAFPGTYTFTTPPGPHRYTLTIAKPSLLLEATIGVSIVRGSGVCVVQASNAALTDRAPTIDGQPVGGAARIDLRTIPCASDDQFSVDGNVIGAGPISVALSKGATFVLNQQNPASSEATTFEIDRFPLGTVTLAEGTHHLNLPGASLMPPRAAWSAVEDLLHEVSRNNVAHVTVSGDNGPVDIEMTSSLNEVAVHAQLPPMLRGHTYRFAGSVHADQGDVSVLIRDGDKNTAIASLDFAPTKLSPTFHLDAAADAKHPEIYVYLKPRGVPAGASVHLGLAEEIVGAHVVLAETGFAPSQALLYALKDDGLLRFHTVTPGKVIEYAQTFNDGWRLRSDALHVETTAGTNAFVLLAPGNIVLTYGPGVPFVVAEVVSSLALLGMIVWSMGLPAALRTVRILRVAVRARMPA